MRKLLYCFPLLLAACSPTWREPQPTDDLKAAMQIWEENQKVCQVVIRTGRPCPQPNPPISFVYNAQVGSRRGGFYAGLETFGTVAAQLAPLALPALGAAALAE